MRQLIKLFGQLLAPTSQRFYQALDCPKRQLLSVFIKH